MARGQYIARMDRDDISHPERFKRQVAFLEGNPKIGVLGTQVDKVDADGNVRESWNQSLPTDWDVATWRLLFNICFCHPTVMMRHSLLERLVHCQGSFFRLCSDLKIPRQVAPSEVEGSPWALAVHFREISRLRSK